MLRSSDGVIYAYEYNDQGLRTGELVKKGRTGTANYVSAMDWGDGSSNKPKDRIVATYVYPATGLSRSNGTQTKFDYTFWDGEYTQLKTRITKVPAVVTAENGGTSGSPAPGTASDVVAEEYYDNAGRLRWTKDGEGYVNYYSFQPSTGKQAYVSIDVNPSSLPSSADLSGNADKWLPSTAGDADDNKPSRASGLPHVLAIVTTHEFDAQGREFLRTDPPTEANSSGAKHYFANQSKWDGPCLIAFPYCESSNLENVSAAWKLPMQVIQYDKQHRLAQQITLWRDGDGLTVNGNGVPTALPDGWEPEDRASETDYIYDDHTGRVMEVRRYSDTLQEADTEFTDYFSTRYLYDAEGRIGATIADVEAGKYQVTVTLFDVLGRPVEVRRSVQSTIPTSYAALSGSSVPSGYATISKTTYDSGGIGDSHVTSMKSFFGTSSTLNIETLYKRTFRGHLRGFERKITGTLFSPYTVQDVDWMGRVKASASYISQPTWATVLTSIGYTDYVYDFANSEPEAADHKDLVVNRYDTLYRVFRTERYPGVETANHFIADNFYDRNNQLVCTGDKYSAHTEYAYDGAGRRYQSRTVQDVESTKYTSGKFNYRDPLPDPFWKAGTSAIDTSDVQSGFMSGGDDKVIELTHVVFDAVGNIVQQHTFESNHDDSDGIDLTNNDDYVRRSTYSWCDAADRVKAMADFGSGDTTSGAGVWKYTSVPGRSSSALTVSSETKLVTQYGYVSGPARYQTTTDPAGMVTKTIYDNLGRRTFVAENYDNATPTTGAGGGTNNEKDRVTIFAYNGLGQQTSITAVNVTPASGTVNEVTKYLYRDPYNASLVTNTIYPDSSDTDHTGTDQVKMTYDLDGKVATRTDQRGVVITYSYDADARQLSLEAATTIPSGLNIDTTVRSIRRLYDGFGRLGRVTSHSETTGSESYIINEVKYGYGTTGLNAISDQDHVDKVGTGASNQSVQYAFDESVTSYVYINGLRPKYVTYPNGRKIHTTYGSPGSNSEVLHRVDMLEADSSGSPGTDLVQYAYNGTGRLAVADYGVPDLKLDLFQGTSGTYAGYDRFGRTVRQEWDKYNTSAGVRDRQNYTYDYAGNRLTAANDHNLCSWLDFKYQYDSLHRYVKYEVGTLSSGSITNLGWQEVQTLDQLGNWTRLQWGVALDYLDQSRAHNAVNETGTIGVNSGVGDNWVDPVHDAAGNMTTTPKSNDPTNAFALKYDAWNRLVEVKSGANTVQKNDFDGLGRRVVRHVYASGSPSHKIHYYYNDQWQLLEERKEPSGSAEVSDPLAQYVWHPYYIDALAIRYYDADIDGNLAENNDGEHYYLHDANFNVRAVTNSSGTVLERNRYTPYGGTWFLDASFNTLSGNLTTIGNTHVFTGRERDPETGLQLNRHRFYSDLLGRWLTRDPIGYKGGSQNLYEYVTGMPTGASDPSGLKKPGLPLIELPLLLYAQCLTLPNPEAVLRCMDEVNNMFERLNDVKDSITKQGGPSRFSFNGPVCSDCESEVNKAIGNRPAKCFFEYKTKTKQVGFDHVWGEIHFHSDEDTARGPGNCACTIDFWGSFDCPCHPESGGFGWIADEDRK